MVAFHQLYRLKTQVEAVTEDERLYALAASDGKRHALMLVNLTGTRKQLELQGICEETARYSVIDQERLLSRIPNAKEIGNNTVFLIEWQD